MWLSRIATHSIKKLSPFWKKYFKKADEAILENFWGNLPILKHACAYKDAYAQQLTEMGYCFDKNKETRPSFLNMVTWTLKKISVLVKTKQIQEQDAIVPGKAFQTLEHKIVFVCLGNKVPHGAVELNLLPPTIFVEMLAMEFFPIGEPARLHTNQTRCEHDLAHLCGFISCPEYMVAVRKGFREIHKKMATNAK